MGARRIVVVAFDGLQSLDAVGPIEVFSTTNRELGDNAYALELVAADGPSVQATNGLSLAVDHRISAVREGYEDASVPIVLGAGTTRSVQLELERSRPLSSRWWFWAGAGTLVAATIVVVAVLVSSPSAQPIPPVKGNVGGVVRTLEGP